MIPCCPSLAGCYTHVDSQISNSFNLELDELNTAAARSYKWTISSQLLTAPEITMSINRSATTASYATSVTRSDPALIYTTTGRVLITTSSSTPVAFDGIRVTLLGVPPPSTFAVTCPTQTVSQISPVSCQFNVRTTSAPGSVSAQGRTEGSLLFVDSPSSPVPAADAAADVGNCLQLTDSITAGAATVGIRPVTADGPLSVLGQMVCDTTTLQYVVNVGPFTNATCGSFQVRERLWGSSEYKMQ